MQLVVVSVSTSLAMISGQGQYVKKGTARQMLEFGDGKVVCASWIVGCGVSLIRACNGVPNLLTLLHQNSMLLLAGNTPIRVLCCRADRSVPNTKYLRL